MEDPGVLRMLVEIREKRLSVEACEGRCAGDHRLVELPPWSPGEMRAEHDRPRVNRLRVVAAQCLAELGVSKSAVRLFGKDAETRERAEEAVERHTMRSRGASQVIHALRPGREPIGDAELCRNVDRLDNERARPD